ncbi:hypothetical protein PENTCL1PPCAC_29307, partial [Pristionchus entomophagus]
RTELAGVRHRVLEWVRARSGEPWGVEARLLLTVHAILPGDGIAWRPVGKLITNPVGPLEVPTVPFESEPVPSLERPTCDEEEVLSIVVDSGHKTLLPQAILLGGVVDSGDVSDLELTHGKFSPFLIHHIVGIESIR